MKQQIYENMLTKPIGMDYSPVIKFQTSLIRMEEAKALTMSNQPEKKQQKRCQSSYIKYLQVTSKDFPVELAIRKAAISIRSK